MAKKASTVPSTYSIWSLISDDSRRALVQIHRANVEIERAQRQFKKSASATPLQVAADKAFFGL
jgi:hypothetical protein